MERNILHCSDDDLVLFYYRDAEAPAHAGPHLAGCGECRARYEELADSLRLLMFPETPEPGDRYGAELWHRLESQLPERRPFWSAAWFRPLSFAAAAAVLVIAGFVIGRVTPAPQPEGVQVIDAGEARRVLLMSVADHLERSDRVLTDVMNASFDGGPVSPDIATERQWAADLVTDNRFFRQDAIDSGEPSVAAVLDELERALLDIVHSPSDATQADFEEIHQRLDSAALLFKVRVLSGELRQQQREPRPPANDSSSPSRIS